MPPSGRLIASGPGSRHRANTTRYAVLAARRLTRLPRETEHRGYDLQRAKCRREKFRAMAASAGNGLPLLPAKIPPRSSSWRLLRAVSMSRTRTRAVVAPGDCCRAKTTSRTTAVRKDRSFADEQNRPEALPGDRWAETNALRYRLLRFCSRRIAANSFEPKGPRKSRAYDLAGRARRKWRSTRARLRRNFTIAAEIPDSAG